MTDYAVVLLAEMAKDEGGLHAAASLSLKTNLPEPTVAKILKLLGRGGLISSTRGMNGGYRLTRAPSMINMAAVIAALEGRIALTACVDGGDECCSLSDSCSMKGRWNPVNAAMQKALEDVSLAQMISGAEVRA